MLKELCNPDCQRFVGAFGADSGMSTSEIRFVEFLIKGIKVSDRGGIFKFNS